MAVDWDEVAEQIRAQFPYYNDDEVSADDEG